MYVKMHNNPIKTEINNQSNNKYFSGQKISNNNKQKNERSLREMNKHNFKGTKNNQQFKSNFNPGATNNNYILFNNTFYKTKDNNNMLINDINKKNQKKFVVDIKESIKHGRNSSAPSLKQNDKNTKLISNNKDYKYNKLRNQHNTSFHKQMNKSKIEKKDNSYIKGKIGYKNKLDNSPKISINNRINRINNIKQNFISKTNKKYFKINQNDENEIKTNVLNNTYIQSNKTNKYKNKIKNKDTEENDSTIRTYKDIIHNQEKIAAIQKKLKENKQILRNSRDYNSNSYNKISNDKKVNKNQEINNDNESDDKNISIDNEEKIINIDGDLTEENQIYPLNNYNYNKKKYRDITPDKVKRKFNRSYMNNYDSIEAQDSLDNSSFKPGNSYIKNKPKVKQNKNIYSYNKKVNYVRKINEPKNNKSKDLFNNNNLYNKNYINTERAKNGKKTKKINIINLNAKEKEHYAKSLNIFNTVETNKLNKSSILPNNKNKNNNINKDKKSQIKKKFNESYDFKKNNSAKKTKIKNDIFSNHNNNQTINATIGNRNHEKLKFPLKKNKNKSLNNANDKINSSKVKKNSDKLKIPENKENIKNKEELIDQDLQENDLEKETKEEIIENKTRFIDKIGCICHAGEATFGKPKTNQDNYFNYNIIYDDLIFIGVCDGHGENGHHVSEYLINKLPSNLYDMYANLKNKEKQDFENLSQEAITQLFEESFLKTDNQLNEFCDHMKKKKASGEYVPNFFNCDYSGSTCVSLLLKQRDTSIVYIANVGDSRTIVIRENENNLWTHKQLSRDHKPTEKDEYQRIIDMDGEIEAIEDDNGNWTGPLRVWEKGSEGPGLAMTRSLGDKVGTKLGVVCTPEVFKYEIKDEDRAFIIASDGLWEYMPNEEVTEAVKELILDMRDNNDNNDENIADIISNELFKQAVIRWRQKEPGMDDITIICILLK